MARVKMIEGREAPLRLRLLNLFSRRMLGQEAVPLKILAHNPRFLLPYLAMSRLVQVKTRLDPEIRWLAMHLVAEINGCTWCLDFGQAQALKQGISTEKLAAVADYATSPLFSAAERAALAYAAEATQVGARISDTTFVELCQYLSEQEIVELAVAVASENMFNRFNAPLEVESQGFCAIPTRPAGMRRKSA